MFDSSFTFTREVTTYIEGLLFHITFFISLNNFFRYSVPRQMHRQTDTGDHMCLPNFVGGVIK